jgi:CRISPR-associated protein Cmr1
MMSKELKIELITLTPLWTGGIEGICDRVHETGIIGSVRWWCEAIIRGLGGYACDPTSNDRCPGKDNTRCAACELFGCTGWSRKFRIQILDGNGNLLRLPLKQNQEFILNLIGLKTISDEEKWLLIRTFEVVCQYGALGGKIVLKPQALQKVGQDYGLIERKSLPSLPTLSKERIQKYLLHFRVYDARSNLRSNHRDWADLKWFFFKRPGFLWRKDLNEL